jgi:hypothetical protein
MLSYQNLGDQKHQLQEEPMLLVQQRTLHAFPGMRRAETSPRKMIITLERIIITLPIKSTVLRTIYSTFTQYEKVILPKINPTSSKKAALVLTDSSIRKNCRL